MIPDATGSDPHREQLGDFLRSRRARLSPEEVGMVSAGRRRVPGLRRVEAAQLAGVSIDYYVRLEQGRAAHPSEEILDAVARALRLGLTEREHLFRLARPGQRARRPEPREERVRPAVRRLVDAMDMVPAFVLGSRMDVLAWNRMAAILIRDWSQARPQDRNVARAMFLDPRARDYYADWEAAAREIVANLRFAAGRAPEDPALASLVAELSARSEPFRCWWDGHDVARKSHGPKRLRHPVVGDLTVEYEALDLPMDAGQQLITYTAEPGGDSEAALQLLHAAAMNAADGHLPAAAHG